MTEKPLKKTNKTSSKNKSLETDAKLTLSEDSAVPLAVSKRLKAASSAVRRVRASKGLGKINAPHSAPPEVLKLTVNSEEALPVVEDVSVLQVEQAVPVVPAVHAAVQVEQLVPAEQAVPAVQGPAASAVVNTEKNSVTQRNKVLDSSLRIFQIYFEPWQRELLDPAFYPLDNSRSNSELLEFEVFEKLQRNAATQGASLWGALSWRFAEKTGMPGAEWVKQIVDHPGHDVYFCNPHTYNESLFHNMWLQGETSHPQFLKVTKAFLIASDLDVKDMDSIYPSGSFSAANYFVATPNFWSTYIPFVRRVLVAADKRMPPALRDVMHSRLADDRNLHAGASYLPFIVERLFPLFMRTEGKVFKARKIALPERERELNVHLKLLREMKDVAHKTQSAWLAACWVNYRNLYLSQTKGKAWCEKHLRDVTPTEVIFG